MRRVLIAGAAGRDFHNFNVAFRGRDDVRVVAFTAAQIPDIDGRVYPSALAGPGYPDGIPIVAEEELADLVQREEVDEVVFAYSDVTHEHVMHLGSAALAAGADYVLLGPRSTELRSSKPVVAICAVRTGSGKSQTTRYVAGILRRAGKRVAVIADETRPFLQGLRLTAWELAKDNIPVTVITDNMAGHVMKSGKVDVVVVGADRIAANGDTANKIGTYMVAVLARRHNIPFYVAAPITTLDLSLRSGDEIPIEERDTKEVTHIGEQHLGPTGVEVHNPAFDVTPNDLITAIITDKGVVRAPYVDSLRGLFEEKSVGLKA